MFLISEPWTQVRVNFEKNPQGFFEWSLRRRGCFWRSGETGGGGIPPSMVVGGVGVPPPHLVHTPYPLPKILETGG